MPRRTIGTRVKRGSTEWINIAHPKKADFETIGKQMGLSKEHLNTIMTKSHRSRLFESDSYILMVLIQPTYESERNDVTLKEIDVILTANKVVTIQRGAISNVRRLFKEIEDTKSHEGMKHPAALVSTIMHELISELYTMMDEMAIRLDSIEERILKDKHILEEVLAMQTNIIDFQKALENQSIMLERLLLSVSKQTAKFLETQFNDLRLHLDEIQTSLHMEQMTAETLHRTHETALNARTNAQIRMLTAISLIVLPATLLAGIFGMNIHFPIIVGLPGDFWIVIGIMVTAGLAIHFYGKSQR